MLQQLTKCMQPTIEKNFKGVASFTDDFINNYPDIIDEERRKRTLMYLYWGYQSNLIMISEEILVYDPKDLVAWVGGALGIFMGMGIFDIVKYVIDFIFKGVFRFMGYKSTKESNHVGSLSTPKRGKIKIFNSPKRQSW